MADASNSVWKGWALRISVIPFSGGRTKVPRLRVKAFGLVRKTHILRVRVTSAIMQTCMSRAGVGGQDFNVPWAFSTEKKDSTKVLEPARIRPKMSTAPMTLL